MIRRQDCLSLSGVYRDPLLLMTFFRCGAETLTDGERVKQCARGMRNLMRDAGESPDVSDRQNEDHSSVRMEES